MTPLGTVALALTLLAGLVAWFLLQLRRVRPAARLVTWGCGYAFPAARMEYSAEGYAEPTRCHLLPRWLRPALSGGPPAGLFPAPRSLHQQSPDLIFRRLFQPLFAALESRFFQLRWVQHGKLHLYLLYIFLTCAGLLAWSAWPVGGRSW